MQVMPATGKDMKVGDIHAVGGQRPRGDQVHAFHDRPVLQGRAHGRAQQGALRLRSYNAGPARIRGLRKDAQGSAGSIPNVWFSNVERVVAEKIGRETVTYVSNIFKYYVAYKLTLEEREEKAKDRPPS